MLRCVDGRNAYEIRPDAQWNVEAKLKYLVGAVVEQVGVKNALVVYVGEDDVFFRHVADDDVGGVEILVTGGHAVDGFFVRSAPQVDQLLRWLCEQHAAGVTVRGGKLRPPGRVREEGVRKGKGGKAREFHVAALPGADAAKASASFPVKKGPLGAGPLGRSVDTGIMGYAPATAPGHTRSLSGGKVDLGELLR